MSHRFLRELLTDEGMCQLRACRLASRTWTTVLVLCSWACASGPAVVAGPFARQDMFSSSDAYERFIGRWSRLLAPAMVTFSRDEAVALDPAIEPHDEANMPFCKQGELAALWRQQHLENVQEAPLTVVLRFASFDDYWAPFLLGQGPAGAYVARLSRDRQAALEGRLRKRLLGNGPDHGIDLEARVWAVKGVVPRK